MILYFILKIGFIKFSFFYFNSFYILLLYSLIYFSSRNYILFLPKSLISFIFILFVSTVGLDKTYLYYYFDFINYFSL